MVVQIALFGVESFEFDANGEKVKGSRLYYALETAPIAEPGRVGFFVVQEFVKPEVLDAISGSAPGVFEAQISINSKKQVKLTKVTKRVGNINTVFDAKVA